MTPFLLTAVLMTLSAVLLVVVPLFRSRESRAPVAAVAVALAIPVSVLVLYATSSNYPWAALPPPPAARPDPAVDTPEIVELRQRTQAQPADPQAWSALGDAYMSVERYGDAGQAYRQAITASQGGDDALRLAFAEAAILEDRNALLGDAGKMIDDVLSRDPFNPKGLWYGGMVALARGDADQARQRWSKLLDLSPPPRVRQILEQQLASLGAGPGAPAPGGAATPQPGVRIPVRIAISPALAARVKPDAVLFLFAREADGAGGPPLAVVRRAAPALPLDLEISDADSMVPGRSLAGRAEVRLTARLAGTGDAMAASGDVFGEATWKAGTPPDEPLRITIDQVVP